MAVHPFSISTPTDLSCIDDLNQAVRVNVVATVAAASTTYSSTNIQGDVAHDSPDSGNPVKIGARARSSLITPVSNDDRTDLTADLYGRLQVITTDTDKSIRGTYIVGTPPYVVTQTANAGTAGLWYLLNPKGSGITTRVVRVQFVNQIGSALVTTGSPRLAIQRFAFGNSSFSGTSNATLAAVFTKCRTADSAAKSLYFDTSSDSTISLVGLWQSFLPVSVMTAASGIPPVFADLPFNYARWLDLAEGEGIALRQLDAGTASDTRRYVVTPWIEEY